ncbi:tight adherence protein B [Roseinatronobacter thiooxidans]|uniref:Tight adherence protein B n=1 Tax=Roseinatronobacter thiooxidans TaxID=121821 RepID=A0A2W7PJ03_9RHOB|nr:type II secretion system F family protein [Roseinatronobacter thiooxidans]PZX36211.1 tight adherence protein B [Roseinatronobacter thiooxidans]
MADFLSRIDPNLLLFIGIFIGVLLLVEGIRQVLSRRETTTEARSRRMKMVCAGTSQAERLAILAPKRHSNGSLQGFMLQGLLLDAGLPPRPWLFAGAAVLSAALIAVAFKAVIGLFQAIALAVAICIVLPFLLLRAARTKRRNALVAQLPDALDLMARGLKAGHPLNTSIATVADTMPDPIGSEFGIIVDQVSYGDDVVTAVRKLAERVPTEDFQYLAASISIQHGTGGNLGQVLNVLAQVIRGRVMMRRKIKAMSAEGRISAMILSGLPFVIFGLNSIITPEYYGGVMDYPLFIPLAVAAVGLVILNALILFKLVNFRI